MGLGGIQKRVRDIVLDLDKNYPAWDVYLLVKFKQVSHFAAAVENTKNVHVLYYSKHHRKSIKLPSFFWIIHQFITIRPHVCLTFLDHLSITMVLIKHVFFWLPTKVVLNEGVLTSRYLEINRHRIWYWLVKAVYKYADQFIVPTHSVQHDLEQHFQVSRDKIKVIPNWTLFLPVIKKSPPLFDLVFTGRFEKEKNPFAFLRVVKRLIRVLPNIQAVLLGDGRQAHALKKFVRLHGMEKNVHFLGVVSDPAKVVKGSRLLVMTTLNEGMPNVVLEAGMLEVPVVCTNFSGVGEVVHNGMTGWITKNEVEMTKKIYLLLHSPEELRMMGVNARRHVEQNFSRKRQTEFIRTLLNT